MLELLITRTAQKVLGDARRCYSEMPTLGQSVKCVGSGQSGIHVPQWLSAEWYSLSTQPVTVRDISLTTGGGDRHVRQISPAIFGDPPYLNGP